MINLIYLYLYYILGISYPALPRGNAIAQVDFLAYRTC